MEGLEILAIRGRLIRLLRAVWLPNEVARDRWVEAEAALTAPGARVLDAGAGSSPYAAFFGHCGYVSQDFRRLPAEALRGKTGYGNLSCEGDVHRLPFRRESFDVVLCTEVLEHVRQPSLVISELAQVLRPGGKLIASAPLGSWEHQAPWHFYGGFTRFWWEAELRDHGFVEWSVSLNGGFYRVLAQECFRAAMERPPWRGWRELSLSPLWLVTLPISAFLLPILAPLMDRWFPNEGRCFGLHVVARRG